MRITKNVALLSILLLLFSLSACKQPSNDQPEAEELVISAAPPEVKETAPQASEKVAPHEKILVDDSDADEKIVEVTDKDFNCIRDMQAVRGMYVGNLLGNIDATQAVANSEEGGVYPPGTVIQIVPGEAMVKREQGFNAATNDWEFFVLNVSPEGTQIANRGGEEVKTALGQDCLSCHAQAEPKWDMICETGHGCAPIPITRDMIVAQQKTDQRCAPMPLDPIDEEALADLQKLIAAFTAQATPDAAEETTEEEAPAPEPVEEITETEKAAPVAEGEKSKE